MKICCPKTTVHLAQPQHLTVAQKYLNSIIVNFSHIFTVKCCHYEFQLLKWTDLSELCQQKLEAPVKAVCRACCTQCISVQLFYSHAAHSLMSTGSSVRNVCAVSSNQNTGMTCWYVNRLFFFWYLVLPLTRCSQNAVWMGFERH